MLWIFHKNQRSVLRWGMKADKKMKVVTLNLSSITNLGGKNPKTTRKKTQNSQFWSNTAAGQRVMAQGRLLHPWHKGIQMNQTEREIHGKLRPYIPKADWNSWKIHAPLRVVLALQGGNFCRRRSAKCQEWLGLIRARTDIPEFSCCSHSKENKTCWNFSWVVDFGVGWSVLGKKSWVGWFFPLFLGATAWMWWQWHFPQILAVPPFKK